MRPTLPLLLAPVVAALIAVTACASAPTPGGRSMQATPDESSDLQPVKQWPLRFKAHSFSAYTYDTRGAKVVYAGHLQVDDDPDVLKPSSAGYGPDWQRGWHGSHLGIRNFPPPARLEWRSKDGTTHRAEIDIAAIFADEVVRHRVAREDMAPMVDGEYQSMPAIILEINDRTVRVYMKAFILLRKKVEIAGVMRYDLRSEPIVVYTENF